MQKIDKDVLDIARHRLTEVLKEAGLDGHDDSSQSSKVQHPAQVMPGALELVGRQLSAAEAAQRHSEKVSKQLLEAQQVLLKRGRAMEESSADDTAKGQGRRGYPTRS